MHRRCPHGCRAGKVHDHQHGRAGMGTPSSSRVVRFSRGRHLRRLAQLDSLAAEEDEAQQPGLFLRRQCRHARGLRLCPRQQRLRSFGRLDRDAAEEVPRCDGRIRQVGARDAVRGHGPRKGPGAGRSRGQAGASHVQRGEAQHRPLWPDTLVSARVYHGDHDARGHE